MEQLVVNLGTKWVEVDDLTAASRACRHYIESRDLGSRDWSGERCGQVVDASTRRVVANISYNGRVWLPDGTEAPRA